MINCKKVIISIGIIMMVMCFYVGYSYSQEHPSQDIIKNIIMRMELGNNINNKEFSNLKYDTLQIINSFVSKTPGGHGESSPYCIEVNYKISYIFNENIVDKKKVGINDLKLKLADNIVAQTKGPGDYSISIKLIKESILLTEQMPDIIKHNMEIVRNNIRLSFIKKENQWYGYNEWK
jgi:hypothetical protein